MTAALTILVTLGACVTQEDVQKARDTTAIVVEETQALFDSVREERDAALLRAEQAVITRDIARAEAESLFAAQLDERLGDIQMTLDMGNEALERFDESLANWEGPGGLLQSFGEMALPFVPAPAQGGVVTALGIGGLIVRLVQKSKGLNSLALSTVKLAEKNESVARAIQDNAEMLRDKQSGAARKAIDSAQNGKKMSIL
jgi:hypothetical protein